MSRTTRPLLIPAVITQCADSMMSQFIPHLRAPVTWSPTPHSDVAPAALAVIDGVGGFTASACSSRRGGADEFANRGCGFAAVVAGVGPFGGVGLVGVVFDCDRRATIEQ